METSPHRHWDCLNLNSQPISSSIYHSSSLGLSTLGEIIFCTKTGPQASQSSFSFSKRQLLCARRSNWPSKEDGIYYHDTSLQICGILLGVCVVRLLGTPLVVIAFSCWSRKLYNTYRQPNYGPMEGRMEAYSLIVPNADCST